MTLKPDSIEPRHWNEWLLSGVDPTLIALNVTSLLGDRIYEYLCYSSQLERTNTGRLVSSIIHRYSHATVGGWWCSGLDPLNNWEPMLWGCFKPDNPRHNDKGKPIKYEHPLKTPTRAFFLRVPCQIWQRIAQRYRVVMPENLVVEETGEAMGFWAWVLNNPEIPILLTEGVKKAGALLSAGYAAIALPGIWNGRRVRAQGASLIPELQILANVNRLVYFCFDRDTKPKTVAAVKGAIAKTGQLFTNNDCLVRVITWDAPYKGVDDFIVAAGLEAFDGAYQEALNLGQWQWACRQEKALTIVPQVRLNVADLSTIGLQLPESGIIAIVSAKGTGKTKVISQATESDESLLSLTHRIFLGRSLAQRLGYTWRTDADKALNYFLTQNGQPTFRLGCCVESLLAVVPEWIQGGTVVIDEVCQVLQSLLTSSTCNKEGKRPALLARFEAIIKAARRIIIADADLNNHAIHYIQQLREDETGPYLIRNDYKPMGYSCTIYNCPDSGAIVADTIAAVAAGKRLFIATDSKTLSQVLAQLIEEGASCSQNKEDKEIFLLPTPRILAINSETASEDEQREYVRQINQQLPLYDIVIATPSMSTGVSIESEWFDEVIGIFHGVVNDADIAQALARVRSPIPRRLWVASRGKNFCRVSKSEYPFIIKRDLKTRWDLEIGLIRMSLSPELLAIVDTPVDWERCPHKQLWAQMEANNNAAMWNLQDSVIARLRYEGNQVRQMEAATPSNVKSLTKEARKLLDAARYQAIAQAKILSPLERDELESKEGIKREDRLNLEKTQVADWAAIEDETDVTKELVELYSELGAAIMRYEDLRSKLAIERDVRAIAKQAQWHQGLFIPDLSTREQERKIRDRLGLMQWIKRLLDGETLTNEDLEPLGQQVRYYWRPVNQVLRLGFSPDSAKWSNVRIFNQLMKQLGIPTTTLRVGKAKVSTTSLDRERWEPISEILERREERRAFLAAGDTTVVAVAPSGEENLQQCQVDNGSFINNQETMSISTPNTSQPHSSDKAAVPETRFQDKTQESRVMAAQQEAVNSPPENPGISKPKLLAVGQWVKTTVDGFWGIVVAAVEKSSTWVVQGVELLTDDVEEREYGCDVLIPC